MKAVIKVVDLVVSRQADFVSFPEIRRIKCLNITLQHMRKKPRRSCWLKLVAVDSARGVSYN